MLAAMVLALAAGAAEPPAKEPAAKLELFAKEDFYKNEKGKEEDFVGVLEKVKGPEVGFGRFNPYRLVMGNGDKKTTREVYVGAKTDILNDYVGRKIKLTGKAVDMEVEGTMHKEIWPARLELVTVKKEEKKDGAKKDEPPAKADILATHKLYKMEPGQEKEFVGVLQKRDKGGYYLDMKDGDKGATEDLILYGDAGDPLAPYVGKKVKVFGKQVAGAVGMRTFRHTLPGRLEVVAADKDEAKKDDKGPKILATGTWSSKQTAPRTVFIRSADGAALAMGVAADKAKDEAAQKEATAFFAKALKKDTIDWDKQMVLVVEAGQKNTGGYSVEVTGLEVKDKTLIVKWKVNAPKPGSIVTQAITHPATVVLVERFDGEIKFDPPADKPNDKDK